jgi:hypothetical protein
MTGAIGVQQTAANMSQFVVVRMTFPGKDRFKICDIRRLEPATLLQMPNPKLQIPKNLKFRTRNKPRRTG